jgi:hypothetical protein
VVFRPLLLPLLFEAFVEVSKSFGSQDVAEQLRDYARQIQAMSDDEYNSGIRRPIH